MEGDGRLVLPMVRCCDYFSGVRRKRQWEILWASLF